MDKGPTWRRTGAFNSREELVDALASGRAHWQRFDLDAREWVDEEPQGGPGPKCLVCGHYHGGQGACITAHAFVAPKDCPKCVEIGWDRRNGQ